jgi:hypothetical protein
MADQLDAGIADLILREFEARGLEIVARCEAAVIRRALAGEPVADAFRDELRRALAALAALERDVRIATVAAAAETAKFYDASSSRNEGRLT